MPDAISHDGLFVPGRPRPYRRLQGFDYTNPDVLYFVTIRASEQSLPFADDRLARLVVDALQWLRSAERAKVYPYVLMPDHLHILLRLHGDHQTLGTVIGQFKSFTTKQSWTLGFNGRLWQMRFHDRIVRGPAEAVALAEYMRQNPVRGGLVTSPEMYGYFGMPDDLGHAVSHHAARSNIRNP